jgi:hypothetical protein
MEIRRKKFVKATDHEPTREAKQTSVASQETTHSRVTAASSQEAATGSREKDGQKPKPPAGQPESKAIPKLPFEFADQRFSELVYRQIGEACLRKNTLDVDLLFSMESLLKGQKPKDPYELMLMNHMSGVNASVMKFFGRLASADSPIEMEIYERMLNRLMRSFTSQMDTLQRYRAGGDKNVTVHNVSVTDGGQAIVGNITQNANADGKAKAATTPAAITDAHSAPMPILERTEQPVTVPAKRRPRQ